MIDHIELRRLAEDATPGAYRTEHAQMTAADKAYVAALTPEVVLALLNENRHLRDIPAVSARAVNLCGDPLTKVKADSLHLWCADRREHTCLSGNAGLAFLDAIARLQKALARQCNNVAFVLNHVELYGMSDKLARDLEADRAILEKAHDA